MSYGQRSFRASGLNHRSRRIGSWTVEENYQDVWIVHYDGEEPLEEVDSRYYSGPRGGAMPFNPMDYIDRVDARMLTDL